MAKTKINGGTAVPALPKKERKDLILRQVNIHTRLMFNDLVALIDVSEDTIRRDINELAEEGKVIRIKGGVMSAAYHYGHEAETYAQKSKAVIADKVLSLLKDDIIILAGGGTTIREFIKRIPPTLRATFITVNVLTAVELLDKPMIRTIMIGGQVSAYSQMTVSGEVFEYLAGIKADLCIMGTNAIDQVAGLTDSDWETIQVKKAMIKAAEKVAILAISEKLDSTMQMKIADIDEVDYLVTELPPDHPNLQAYRLKDLTIL
ncbi:DeoR/GlpR family DNA-binding transcription regulator [Dinghuibacter silviterrae]|uniref:DeoR family transcriptional regulator n=1 Tax=Dinghuibacter silviterrae TaxID=1539049 RepID=A0A4R8DVB0_9BACT|nr:DeoR/GlpR family DNA-binding transcription regulator [Dinghuibacter silviterrae]TDX02354.1 DeoR family transcriptional regulator [Dinghuibacter silviterrae]